MSPKRAIVARTEYDAAPKWNSTCPAPTIRPPSASMMVTEKSFDSVMVGEIAVWSTAERRLLADRLQPAAENLKVDRVGRGSPAVGCGRGRRVSRCGHRETSVVVVLIVLLP